MQADKNLDALIISVVLNIGISTTHIIISSAIILVQNAAATTGFNGLGSYDDPSVRRLCYCLIDHCKIAGIVKTVRTVRLQAMGSEAVVESYS